MSDKMKENVLVIPREAFDARNPFQGFTTMGDRKDLGEYLASNPDEPQLGRFMPRGEAETDPGWLQIIPYVVLMQGSSVFCYSRNKEGGEQRLHGFLSIGVGGHINDEDHSEPFQAYMAGLARELMEEVGLPVDDQEVGGSVIGMVQDSSSPVGAVHLGIVHIFSLDPNQAAKVIAQAESCMSDPCFRSVSDFAGSENYDQLETWSQHIAAYLLTKLTQPKPWERQDVIERLQLLVVSAANIASSAGTLLMRDSPREWQMQRQDLENALGQFSCILTGCCTNGDVSTRGIAQATDNFRQAYPSITRHQPASTQPQ